MPKPTRDGQSDATSAWLINNNHWPTHIYGTHADGPSIRIKREAVYTNDDPIEKWPKPKWQYLWKSSYPMLDHSKTKGVLASLTECKAKYKRVIKLVRLVNMWLLYSPLAASIWCVWTMRAALAKHRFYRCKEDSLLPINTYASQSVETARASVGY